MSITTRKHILLFYTALGLYSVDLHLLSCLTAALIQWLFLCVLFMRSIWPIKTPHALWWRGVTISFHCCVTSNNSLLFKRGGVPPIANSLPLDRSSVRPLVIWTYLLSPIHIADVALNSWQRKAVAYVFPLLVKSSMPPTPPILTKPHLLLPCLSPRPQLILQSPECNCCYYSQMLYHFRHKSVTQWGWLTIITNNQGRW